MSLNSLRSLTGAASLATTAFDTARSTIKAMADATAAESESAPTAPTASERIAAAEAKAVEKPKSNGRLGTVLDAYA